MYRKENNGLLKHIDFVLLDLLCLQIAFVVVFIIFRGAETLNPYGIQIYRNMAVLIELVGFLILFADNTLKGVLKRGYYKEFVQTVKQAFYTFALSIFFLYLMKDAEQYSRLVFGFTFVLYGGLSYVVRILWKRRLQRKMEGEGEKSLLIITNRARAKKVINNIREHNYARFRLTGLVLLDDDKKEKSIA